MYNRNKNNFLMVILILIAGIATNVNSQSMDSSFSYQGELLDNGAPANGQYDINFDLIDGDLMPWGNTSEHSPVDVVNGLFNVNVDFDISSYDGYKDFTITVSVRKTSEGPDGTFTVLGSQTVQAVPMATNLINGNAISGQVLTFNGFQWTPSDPIQSPWTVLGPNISYMGEVSIGNINPLADFSIDATADGDVVRVRVDGLTKFYVDDNGGTGVGSWSIPPTNGLIVRGDMKQPTAGNGMMKYMVYAGCGAFSSIKRSYNGVNDTSISIVSGTGDIQCVITFPNDINDRFWQVSPVINNKDRGAHCSLLDNNKLNCYRYTTSTGENNGGDIMVLIY